MAPGETYEMENMGMSIVMMGMLGAADGLVSLSVGAIVGPRGVGSSDTEGAKLILGASEIDG